MQLSIKAIKAPQHPITTTEVLSSVDAPKEYTEMTLGLEVVRFQAQPSSPIRYFATVHSVDTPEEVLNKSIGRSEGMEKVALPLETEFSLLLAILSGDYISPNQNDKHFYQPLHLNDKPALISIIEQINPQISLPTVAIA